jgi:hypothetical protein
MGAGREPATSTGLPSPQGNSQDVVPDGGRGGSRPALNFYSLLAGTAIVGTTALAGQVFKGLGSGLTLALQAATALVVAACAVWAAEPVVAWMFPRSSHRRDRR